jgi:hypothetical protein
MTNPFGELKAELHLAEEKCMPTYVLLAGCLQREYHEGCSSSDSRRNEDGRLRHRVLNSIVRHLVVWPYYSAWGRENEDIHETTI